MTDTNQPLVILHVTAPARVGGLERVVEALTVGHSRAGHSVHVAAVVDKPEDADHFLRPLEALGIHPHPLVYPGRSYLRERSAIRDLCRSIRPAVVHTHGYRADVLAASAARSLGIPTVSTVHGFTGGSWRNRLYEAIQIRAFRRFDSVVAVSAPLAELLTRRGVPKNRLRVLVNAWSPSRRVHDRADARRRLGLSPTAFCVAWLGRLTHEKGADVLLSAVPRLNRDVSVSFIGDGRERPALMANAAALGVSDRVVWHGVVADAAAFLPAFDAFVLSSRTEGTPIALFEAMSARVPIVATQVGGVPDVVTEAEAMLVPAENPADIAVALENIQSDPVASAKRAQSAKTRLERSFAVEPWLDAYECLYRQITRVSRASR